MEEQITTDTITKDQVSGISDIQVLRNIANDFEITFSGNTGIDTLKNKISEYIDSLPTLLIDEEIDEEIQVAPPLQKKAHVPTVTEYAQMDPTKEEDPQIRRQIVRAKALRLHRIKIINLDPADAQLSGGIITAYNKYLGKVAKFVPYGDESSHGYHVPEIIFNQLKTQKFALRREKKNSKFGVKAYTTTMVNKFAIEELPLLTKKELEDLAARQAAAQSISN